MHDPLQINLKTIYRVCYNRYVTANYASLAEREAASAGPFTDLAAQDLLKSIAAEVQKQFRGHLKVATVIDGDLVN